MSDLVERLRTHLKDYGAAVEAADRIEALEARNRDLVTQCDTHARHKMAFKDRIEALEAALRQIMEHPAGLYEAQYDIASAALGPEPNRPVLEIGSEILLSGDFEITQEGKKP